MSIKFIYILDRFIGKLIAFLLTCYYSIQKVFVRSKADLPSRKILFLKFIEQGALVLQYPAFKKAAEEYGPNNVYICVFSESLPIIDKLNIFPPENIFHISGTDIFKFIEDNIRILLKIRKHKIDSSVDLEFFSTYSAIFSFLSGCNKRAGYHRYSDDTVYRGGLLTHRIVYNPYQHVYLTGLTLLESLHRQHSNLPIIDEIIAPEFLIPQISISVEEQKKALGLIDNKEGKIIIINPNLNDILPLRKWPKENYCELAQKIIEQQKEDVTLVFTGRKDEFSFTETLISEIGHAHCFNLCGKTNMDQLFALYSLTSLIITSDSGPGHFAMLTRTPTIVLFGPETPLLYGPPLATTRVLYKGIPCSPCFNVYNNRTSSCRDNRCVKMITVDEVYEEVKKLNL